MVGITFLIHRGDERVESFCSAGTAFFEATKEAAPQEGRSKSKILNPAASRQTGGRYRRNRDTSPQPRESGTCTCVLGSGPPRTVAQLTAAGDSRAWWKIAQSPPGWHEEPAGPPSRESEANGRGPQLHNTFILFLVQKITK